MFSCEICEIFKNTYFEEHYERLLLYFHYNSHYHFPYHHFHSHCKMHLYCLRILLPSPLDSNVVPYQFQINFVFFFQHTFFSSLIPSFLFFTPSKRTQNLFMTTRQILDVFFILIFISIVIYTFLITLNCLYLFTRTYLYVLFIPLYDTDEIVEIWEM